MYSDYFQNMNMDNTITGNNNTVNQDTRLLFYDRKIEKCKYKFTVNKNTSSEYTSIDI